MTWTVTAKGVNDASYTGTAVASVALTGLSGIPAGDSVIMYGSYGSFGAGVPSGTDSIPNTYTSVGNLNEATNGQAFCALQSLNISSGPTSVTLQFSPNQSFVAIGAAQIHNSVAGSPTLHDHSAKDNTVASTSAVSNAINSTNGDLVVAILGVPNGGNPSALTITGVTSPTIINSDGTAGLALGYGTTTTTGTVTATFTIGSNASAVIILTLTPPAAAGGCGSLPLLGVGCSVGWRAALVGGASARLSRAIRRNATLSRRSLLIGRMNQDTESR